MMTHKMDYATHLGHRSTIACSDIDAQARSTSICSTKERGPQQILDFGALRVASEQETGLVVHEQTL